LNEHALVTPSKQVPLQNKQLVSDQLFKSG
jgi:hypothetical protein